MIYQTDDNYWQAYIKSTFNLMADYNTKDSLLSNNTIVEMNDKKQVLAEYQYENTVGGHSLLIMLQYILYGKRDAASALLF